MSLSKPPRRESFPKRLSKEYIRCLRERPVLTKGCTSAFTGALASIISQVITEKGNVLQRIRWRSVAAYAGVGVVFIGPSVHYFHAWLDRVVPQGTSNMALKRLLLDRILFSPNFLVVYLYLLAVFEGLGHRGGVQRLKMAYVPALLMNLKVWTVLQYVNVKYIPQQYRAPFMSFMALFWTIYIATRQKTGT